MIKSNKLYNALKFIALVVLPGLGTLYFALAQIWHLPDGTEIVGSITAVDTFMGVALHINTQAYNKSDARFDGQVNVIETPEKKTFSLTLNGDPDDLDKQPHIMLKVQPSGIPLDSPPRQ